VRPCERVVFVVRVEADDQLVAVDAAAHMASDHERQSAEHLPLAHVGAVGEQRTHARGEFLVVGHVHSRSVRGRPKEAKTLVSGKPVIAATRLPLIVRTNALAGWWWVDPLTALVIAAVALKEGRESWRGEGCCDAC
jgi:hypothetical protein